MPESRYVLPSFVERTSYGVKESNPYNKLFEERIIFLGVQIDARSRCTSTRRVVRSPR
jgi:ATP-dependent Clp protease protease subunit